MDDGLTEGERRQVTGAARAEDGEAPSVLPDSEGLVVAEHAGPDAMANGEGHAQEGVAGPEDQRLTRDRREEAVEPSGDREGLEDVEGDIRRQVRRHLPVADGDHAIAQVRRQVGGVREDVNATDSGREAR